ncbi:ABC transporter substrate-binding protein [Solibacillus sp. MA9]|uniref:ABC transporter substrate-binding protein n=1 Tax=Solibacillus palustris TaxID=2908203 RepID=A0ABS9UA92_9BACL|nr:ABC transporter substrate-binding protein [Solibacillus sp. MA9]MCH7321244.1 ABC transporter substrate-binding protein [Solibacillus sp. MA9]
MKKYLIFIVSMLVAILLVACSNDDSSTSTDSPNTNSTEDKTNDTASDNSATASEIKIANDQEPAGLDPHKVPAASSSRIYSQIYEGLLSFDEKMNIVGSLATEWNQENETTYVFTLKQGVQFHNGREMKAEDVKFSFERILDENTASHIRSYFADVASIEVVGDYEVKFTLSKPNATFLSNLTHASAVVVPKETVEANGDLQQNADGTGPFKLEQWVPDNNVTLVRNEAYHVDGEPKAAKIAFYTMTEESARLSAIRTGEIDFTTISAKSTKLLEGNGDINIIPYQSLEYSYVGFNNAKAPLDNEKVRQALSLATDRQSVLNVVWNGEGLITGPIAPSMGDWSIDVEAQDLYKLNIEKAKALLAEAGLADGFDITITTASTYPDMVDTAQLLQQQWKEIGVNATIKQIEWGEYVDTWSNKTADILIGRNTSGIDPDRALNYFFSSTGSANVWNFSNKAYDDLVAKGLGTTDEVERQKVYVEAQEMLINLSPNLFLVSPKNYVAVRKDISGYTPYPHNASDYNHVEKK